MLLILVNFHLQRWNLMRIRWLQLPIRLNDPQFVCNLALQGLNSYFLLNYHFLVLVPFVLQLQSIRFYFLKPLYVTLNFFIFSADIEGRLALFTLKHSQFFLCDFILLLELIMIFRVFIELLLKSLFHLLEFLFIWLFHSFLVLYSFPLQVRLYSTNFNFEFLWTLLTYLF